MPAIRLNTKAAFACIAITMVGAAYCGLYFLQYRDFHLFGDDVAFFAGVVDGSWLSWISDGYSRYFMIYPQWTHPFTNFIRPVGNFIFYIEYVIFGRHFGAAFIVFYGLILANAFLLRRVLIALKVPPGLASLAGLLFLINPAVINGGLLAFAFQSDLWAGFFVLAAFDAVLRRRLASALMLLLLSVFTKEAALFAPVAAAIAWYFLYRRRVEASALLLPLLLWLAVRWFAFGTLGGAYAGPADLRSLATNAAEGLVLWPLGADFETLRGGLLGTAPRNFSTIEPIGRGDFGFISQIFLIIGNAVLWLAIATATLRAGKFALAHRRGLRISDTALSSPQEALLAITMVWLLGALSFGVLAGHDSRLGACIYEFLLISCALLLETGRATDSQLPRSVPRVAAAIICVAFLLQGFSWERGWRERYATIVGPELQLDRALYNLPSGTRDIYVINGPVTYSSPLFLSDALALPLTVSYFNQFVGCSRAQGEAPTLQGRHLTIRLPSCAQIIFPGADTQIVATGVRGTVERRGIGRYHFPNGRIIGHGIRNANELHPDYGNVITIDLQIETPATLLYFDWQTGQYRTLGTYTPSL